MTTRSPWSGGTGTVPAPLPWDLDGVRRLRGDSAMPRALARQKEDHRAIPHTVASHSKFSWYRGMGVALSVAVLHSHRRRRGPVANAEDTAAPDAAAFNYAEALQKAVWFTTRSGWASCQRTTGCHGGATPSSRRQTWGWTWWAASPTPATTSSATFPWCTRWRTGMGLCGVAAGIPEQRPGQVPAE